MQLIPKNGQLQNIARIIIKTFIPNADDQTNFPIFVYWNACMSDQIHMPFRVPFLVWQVLIIVMYYRFPEADAICPNACLLNRIMAIVDRSALFQRFL